ncbi:MAG: hypothetical protein M3Y56_09905 [Armatimonadota bacterium]|nr:hypothetical protein [Armatimonadota bacterium]
MSLGLWFKNFRESCNKKQDAKSQIRTGTSSQVRMADAASSWSVVSAPTAASGNGHSNGGSVALMEPPSLMSDRQASVKYLADIPGEMRDRLQQEGMSRVFRRLETPLRALNMATSSKGVNYPAEELRGFLVMWRQALSDYVGLLPDDRSVLVYERSVDEAYFVRGRCQVGATLTVVEPCWRLNGEVVIRGEALVVQGC